jgi:hypothetical protein
MNTTKTPIYKFKERYTKNLKVGININIGREKKAPIINQSLNY